MLGYFEYSNPTKLYFGENSSNYLNAAQLIQICQLQRFKEVCLRL